MQHSPSSPSNCSMASTALSCVLWWRWFGILVMFQGMDRHSGIRTGSQDAAWTAAGHRAQDTASRDTESPGESMSGSDRVWSVQFSSNEFGGVSVLLTEFNPRQGRGFPAERRRCCPVCKQLEEAGGAAFLFRLSPPPPLPLSLLPYTSSSPLLFVPPLLSRLILHTKTQIPFRWKVNSSKAAKSS